MPPSPPPQLQTVPPAEPARLCPAHPTETATIRRPAKASRDGLPLPDETIPDGFYLIGTQCELQSPSFQWLAAIVSGVRKVTHIAPPDENGQIIEEDVLQHGVIGIPPPSAIGLCAGVTNAK